jgi:SOS response regulatory protein OraA/RecX
VPGDEEHARELAAQALARRDLSRSALEERLVDAGIPPGVAAGTVAALGRAGFVDDARTAAARAERLAERGLGDAAIVAKLEADRIAPEELRVAIAALEPEADRARAIVRADRGRGARELGALLGRRGFGDDAVEAALALLSGSGTPAPDD